MAHSGLLNINKPGGMTSYSIVGKVKKILGVAKAGHCGTLDPIAEGVLLVLFGSLTKKQSFFMQQHKVYRMRVLLGEKTDTGDITGRLVEKKDVSGISYSDVLRAVGKYKGNITQFTHPYSAVKYKGKRLYKHAREDGKFIRIPRSVAIYNSDVLGVSDKTVELRVECSYGTYMRSLAEDIGEELGCGATVEYLCRERVGEFDLSNSIDGSRLESYTAEELIQEDNSAGLFYEKLHSYDRNI